MSQIRLDARQLLCSLAMLVMASAQSTPLLTTINAHSTSAVQTSSALTDTGIVSATGSPPPVASTTISFASTVPASTPTTSSAPKSSPPTLSVPAIAGIAAGGAFLLIAAAIFITFMCVKTRRKTAKTWPELSPETTYRSTARPVSLRRPSSAATLVNAPAQAYIHSKGYAEPLHGGLHHTKSTKSFKSSRSTILERVSEEAAIEFRFDFGAPPPLEHVDSNDTKIDVDDADAPQLDEDTLQKLSLDKSLPSSPAHEIPMAVLNLDSYQAMAQLEENGRPRSSLYSTATSPQPRETWGGGPMRKSESFF